MDSCGLQLPLHKATSRVDLSICSLSVTNEVALVMTLLKRHFSVAFKLGEKLKGTQDLLSPSKMMRQYSKSPHVLEEKNMSQ